MNIAVADLTDEARRFVESRSDRFSVDELDEDQLFAALVEHQRALHAAGLAVASWPVEYGGRGASAAAAASISRVLGEAQAPELVNFVGTEVLTPALLTHADRPRLARWLPPMAAAEEIWCQMFSEPDAGSDLAALRTRAISDGDGWRVTGQKVWSTWGHRAQWGLLLARTGPPESRHRGITAFVVRMDAPGIEVRPLRTMTGDVEFAEVFLDDVRVAPSGLIGRVDHGWEVALDILAAERATYAVRRASVIRGRLAGLLSRARSERLGSTERRRVVDAYTSMLLLDRRIDEIVRVIDGGGSIGAEAAITKMRLTHAEQSTADAALEALGTGALGWHGPAAPAALSAQLYSRAASIYGGSAQIQRNIIGERLLSLPREDHHR